MRALLLIGLATACAAACATAKPAGGPAGEPDLAPRPFTAEQIRDGMPVGTELRYRLEETGKPTTIMVMKVTAATRAPAPSPRPPRATTRVTKATVDTPAGSVPSVDYEVRSIIDGAEAVTLYRFAASLPGPPVVLTREQGGAVVSRMTLIARSPANRGG